MEEPETGPARLLDAHGRPVRRRELTRPQAEPSLASIRQPWARAAALGLTPERLAQILRRAAEGETLEYVTLAEEMEERDAHYASVLGTRKRAVSAIGPIVEPASDEPRAEEIAEAVRRRICDHDGWADLVEDLLDALGKGWSAVEIFWHRDAGEWWPARFQWADPRWFRWDRDTGRELRLLSQAQPVEGEALAPFKWLLHRPRLKSGLSLRGGLARLVAFGWMAKSYAVKDWLGFAELYGLPIRLGRYGPEATEADVRVLMQAVASIGTDAAAVLPNSMQLEFQELAAKAEGSDLFERLARWSDEQVSKAVLGQTMTADSGSSRAQAEVHDDVRHDILAADARQIAATVNRDLVRAYVDLNWGPQDAYPRIDIPVADPEDVPGLMQSVEIAARLGVTFRAGEIREKLGLSAPEPDDDPGEIVGGSAPLPPAAPPGAPGAARQRRAVPSPALNAVDPVPDDIDVYADLDRIEAEAALDWEPQLRPLIDPIRQLVGEAASLEELRDRLPGLAGGGALAPLIEAVTIALFKARAEGDDG